MIVAERLEDDIDMGEETHEAQGGAVLGPLGEPGADAYLKLLRDGLIGAIRPDLGSDRARGLLDMSLTLLDHLIVRSGPNGAAVAERDAALAQLRAALGDGQIEQAVSDGILSQDPAALAAVREGLRGEARFLGAIDALETEAANARPAPEGRPFDSAAISAYLTRKYGGPVEVAAIGNPIGGFSKDVFILSLGGDARPVDRIVIRRDLPGGPLEGSVSEEYAVLCAAHEAGVPVAAPLWLEEDPAIFGGPTICIAFVEGATASDVRGHIPADKAVASFHHLARAIGLTHAIHADRAGLIRDGESRTAQPHILALLDRFEEQWHRRRGAENIVLTAGFAWMRANLPQEPIPAGIVHGDCSLRNLMVQDGEPTAMLDWETWHLGDPAEDLAYVRDEVESFMPWADFMAVYHAAGAPPVSEERLHYWSIWRELRGSITSISMMDSVPAGRADIRSAFGGIYFTRLLLAKLADRLQQLLAE